MANVTRKRRRRRWRRRRRRRRLIDKAYLYYTESVPVNGRDRFDSVRLKTPWQNPKGATIVSHSILLLL